MIFDSFISIDGQDLTKKYIESLSYNDRDKLIDPIFYHLRNIGFVYPDNTSTLNKEYKRIIDFKCNIDDNILFNNNSIGTYICHYFCKSFYETTDKNNKTMLELFNDDILLKRIIKNRLGMDWLLSDNKGPGVNEAFNFRYKMLIQGMRSMRLIIPTSMFKPVCAKWIVEKYSNPGDVVGDYSIGFGGRLLGTMAAGRKYIGTDPLTFEEVGEMARWYKFKDYTLINSGSEHYRGDKDSVDLYWSSPPYYDQEKYSQNLSQAYNRGSDYFYNTYWKDTLNNIKYMLKPGKWFGLNVTNYPKMLEMAEEIFGNFVETVSLKTVRSHLTKSAGIYKDEYVYMFKNNK